jgi:enoyl-CoA hydratase/carnithine racemase
MADEVVCGVEDGVATVTLNRPERRNAMNGALLAALLESLDALDDRRDVRVVVVRGAGPAFCAGMDLREMEAQAGAAGDPEAGVVAVLQRIERSRHPTLAVLHGDALAGGCQLALHCDLRVAAEGVRLGMPLARIGLIAPFPLAQKLIEVVGAAHARELLFTGRPVDARRAYEIGMVHRVVDAGALEATASGLARGIAANAPLSLAGMKAVVLRALAPRDTVAHDDLDALARRARTSADASEGRRAMLEKRAPRFRGEERRDP